MTETLTGKQVLALLAQDEPPEIETRPNAGWEWAPISDQDPISVFKSTAQFRIKPTPARRLSVTLSNGEVVSWPEPVRDALKDRQKYWYVSFTCPSPRSYWFDDETDTSRLAFGNVHLTREAAQEHADALRKINTQGVGKC